MKKDILNDIIRVNDNLIIPGALIKNFDKFKLDSYELILMIYFINQRDNLTFDVSKISKDLNLDSSKILELINSLNEKNYISIEMKETNRVIEEYISTDLFYNKLSSVLLDTNKEVVDNNIYSIFESEFGRTLSPTECETIDGWIKSGISEEFIKEALKEAILNGVHNMRYIDSILFNWVKKGYKTVEDIKRKPVRKEEDIEKIYDYD